MNPRRKTFIAVATAVVWSTFVDTLDLAFHGSFVYDFGVNTLSGFVLGAIVLYALHLQERHDKMADEKLALCNRLGHAISNPVQTLLNREHLPSELREYLVNQAVKELVRACREVIPQEQKR